MVRKKKINLIDISELTHSVYHICVCVINDNILTDKSIFINYVNQYQNDTYEQLYLKLNVFEKKQFNKIKNMVNLNLNNYDLIVRFTNQIKLTKQLSYFILKYTDFLKLLNNDTNNIDNINYNDLFMLIKDAECAPFWNEQIAETSKKIHLPSQNNIIETNIKPNIFNYKNWFNTEHYISNNKLNNIEINKERTYNQTIKTNKIKLYLNKEQKQFINRLYGAYRYFYNRAIQYINNYNKFTQKTSYLINAKDTVNIMVNLKEEKSKFSNITMRKLLKDNYPEWINEFNIPVHLIDQAFIEASDNYSKCMKKYKENKKPFKLKPKTKKNKYQTINIESAMISTKKNGIFVNLKDQNNNCVFKKIKSSLSFKKILKYCDSSITYNQRLNEYYLNATYNDKSDKNLSVLNNKKVCSIDPGLKTFATIYDDSTVNKIGCNIMEKIKKICNEMDIIQSQMTKKDINNNKKYIRNSNSRRNLKKALHRKIKYLDNLKEELHYKTVAFLCNNYGKIIVPPFETQKMVKTLSHNISRSMMTVSFYQFTTKLKNKCKENDIELVIRPEYYTSKTCGNCGNIKHDLKNENTYKCLNCNIVIDRDMNGARNIMLRNMA